MPYPSYEKAVTTVTATYQALASDDVILVTSGTFTITLPSTGNSAISGNAPYVGQEITVCNVGAGTVTVAGSTANSITDTIINTASVATTKTSKFVRVGSGTGAWAAMPGA